jgi:hypothetical protein
MYSYVTRLDWLLYLMVHPKCQDFNFMVCCVEAPYYF